jgi:hypothetical protein
VLHFGESRSSSSEPTLQGYSAAQWVTGGGGAFGFGVFAGPGAVGTRGGGGGGGRAGAAATIPDGRGRGAAGGERWGVLRVATTGLKPGWLRKNGVPYSESTTITENFMRFSDDKDEWFTVTTTVEDPTYLGQSFITSSNFRREPDGSKWHPTTCRTN